MNLRQQLITVTDAYCKATGLSTSRVSTLIFNAGSRIDQIREGKDLYTARFEHAMRWFSDNWPADAANTWPLGIGRPAPQPKERAEAAQ